MRQRLSREFKRSINASKEIRSNSINSPNPSARYEPFLNASNFSPTRRISHTPSLEGRTSVYSTQIDSIIESAHKVNNKSSRFKRNVMTATDKKRMMRKTDQDQKEEIIDKIIENDVDDYIKYQSVPAHNYNSSPEDRRKYY
jgi:hypothetical protein